MTLTHCPTLFVGERAHHEGLFLEDIKGEKGVTILDFFSFAFILNHKEFGLGAGRQQSYIKGDSRSGLQYAPFWIRNVFTIRAHRCIDYL
jgi:hypothetical protein